MRQWAGKRYWVVGAAEGLGREVALGLSRLGAVLALSDRHAPGEGGDRLAALVAEMPGRAKALPVDLADRASVEAAGRTLGEIDGLVYLADAFLHVGARTWDADRVEAMADTNYRGAVRCVGAVLPGMLQRGRGHIVLRGAAPGLGARPGAIGYAASKAAAVALADSLRSELWRTGVTVQLVALGAGASPQAAAHAVVEHMGGEDFAITVPLGSALAARAGRLLPEWAYQRLFARQ